MLMVNHKASECQSVVNNQICYSTSYWNSWSTTN